jgi:hypothetical protein
MLTLRHIYQRLRYGPLAPEPGAVLWLAPDALKLRLRTAMPAGTWFHSKRRLSGMVLPGMWWRDTIPLSTSAKLAYCTAHWRDGLDWESSGAFVKLRREIAAGRVRDGCATEADMYARFARLDALFAESAARGRVLSHVEYALKTGQNPAQVDGILVHLAPDGTPIFGRSGYHRLAIARLQGHLIMPCKLGVVHPDAMAFLPDLMRKPAVA